MSHRTLPLGDPVLVVGFGSLIAGVNPNTGARLWAHHLRASPGRVRFLIRDGAVVVLADHLRCLDYLTGAVRWVAEVKPAVAGGTLLMHDGKIWVAGAGEVECFSTKGERIWHNPFPGAGHGDVALGFPGNVVQADVDT